MDGGNARDEVREDRRNPLNQLRVEKPNSRNSVNIRITSQLRYVATRDLVFELENVPLPMNIMPHHHDSHEEKSKDERKKPALSELVENRGEIEHLNGAKDENEQSDPPNAGFPNDDHDQRNHAGGHDHDGDDSDAVGVANVLGGPEGGGDDDTGHQQKVVDFWDVDLAFVLV